MFTRDNLSMVKSLDTAGIWNCILTTLAVITVTRDFSKMTKNKAEVNKFSGMAQKLWKAFGNKVLSLKMKKPCKISQCATK